MMDAHVLGIDVGTSGVRVVALDKQGGIAGQGASAYGAASDRNRPEAWWMALKLAIADLCQRVSIQAITAVAVDGTSGTVLAVNADGTPIGVAAMYNEPCEDDSVLNCIDKVAPVSSPTRGNHSALGRAAVLARRPETAFVVHQADWIAMRLGDGVARSDENNALKSGYDLANRTWPDWIDKTGLDRDMLPTVYPAGTPWSTAGAQGRDLGLPSEARIVAGTTDGCASFLATGASSVGEGVTALGSTIVLKLLSDTCIEAPHFGVYSHRVGDLWLAGGASNSGGAVLRHHFTDVELSRLSDRIDPERQSGLKFYPLLNPGERFPVSDPTLSPRLSPRPNDDADFLKAMLEAMTGIEAEGYERLQSLGGPPLRSVRTVGGGANNPAWTQMRRKRLNVDFLPAASTQAATGAARLALKAVQ